MAILSWQTWSQHSAIFFNVFWKLHNKVYSTIKGSLQVTFANLGEILIIDNRCVSCTLGDTCVAYSCFRTESSLWIKLCVNIVYSCVAVVLRACVLMIMDDVNRKRPDAICTGQHVLIWTHRGLSPWQCWFSCYLWNPLISGHLWSPGWPQGRSENWVAVKMYTVIYKTLASGFSQLRQSNAQTSW